jgi:hypothetical protein
MAYDVKWARKGSWIRIVRYSRIVIAHLKQDNWTSKEGIMIEERCWRGIYNVLALVLLS